PLFIVPYYVFPTKPGRHSGFLPFSVGNYQRGDGYIHNVGYYWAASEYWDILAALDYTENLGFNYRGQFRYSLRYVLSGSITGNYANESRYIGIDEIKSKRWSVQFNHSHTISPTFSIKADGTFISDKDYYTDHSINLDDRTDRRIKSKATISKQFGNSSLSAQFSHENQLDTDVRVDQLPTASFRMSSRPIFGSSAKDASGNKIERWYNKFTFGYASNLNNYSYRKTDTTGFRSRKEYMTLNHSPSLGLQQIKISYLNITPSFSYQETWYKVFETDQSLAAGIDASQVYRRYAYSASVSASTEMYGTIEPNLLGLEAVRHVITPRMSFSWAPEITRNSDVKSYTGAGGGGAKQRTVSVGIDNVFQAKVKSGQESKKYDLFYINSLTSYNFEAVGNKWSSLSTSFGSTMLKSINMYITGSMVHDLYEPGTNKLRWWSPYLQSFSISSRFNTGGIFSEFTPENKSDSGRGGSGARQQKWTMSVSHSYRESGRGESFSKSHQINYSLQLALTPTTDISFTQIYDIARKKSINKSLQIRKNLHCWEASFGWVPQGSNQGYWFKINIISIPEIKYEKNESGAITPFSSF
ncbi:MAG: LPS assembly protein LptD, partial [Candidatus Zixiibacteriota bacterium]